MTSVHGTALGVALDEAGPMRGILLVGAPGSGKSRLASELIAHCPFQRTGLIADDLVTFDQGGWAVTPEAGPLLHVRGIGIAEVRQSPAMAIEFIVQLGEVEDQDLDVDALKNAAPVPVDPTLVTAAGLRLTLKSLASGQSLWCGFEPGPTPG